MLPALLCIQAALCLQSTPGPSQWKRKKTDPTHPPTRSPRPFKQHYAGTFVGERQIKQAESIDNTDEHEESATKPDDPLEAVMRLWNFIKDPNHSGAVIAILTLVIAGSNIGYDIVASRQLKSMNSQLTEMQQQTTLQRQQLVGTMAAVVQPDMNWTPVVGVNEFWLSWKNNGHLNASKIQARFKLSKNTLPSKQSIWQSNEFVVSIPDFPPSDSRNFQSSYKFQFSNKEMSMLNDMALTMKVEGVFTYFNGFDTASRDWCFYRFIGKLKSSAFDGGFRSCENFDGDYQSMIDVKKAEDKKH